MRFVGLLLIVLLNWGVTREAVGQDDPHQEPATRDAGSSTLPIAKAKKIVIVISVDGLGDHLLQQVKTPAIDALIKEGQKAPRAETVRPPQTIPAHVSMLSGLGPSQHASMYNELDKGLGKVTVPTIFDLVKRNGLTSSAVLGKDKLKFVLDTGAVTYLRVPTVPLFGDFGGRLPSRVDRAAVKELKEHHPALLVIHYAWPDTMGHWFHWESWPQKQAVRDVDASIGRLMKVVDETLEPGSYAVILTADHGGHEGSHGRTRASGELEDPERDLVIPWIVSGASLKKDVKVVRIYDTAPTVAALLGLAVPQEWNWQGKSVIE